MIESNQRSGHAPWWRGFVLGAVVLLGMAWGLGSWLAIGALLAPTTASGSFRSRLGEFTLLLPVAATAVAAVAVGTRSRDGRSRLWRAAGIVALVWLALMLVLLAGVGHSG